MGGGCGAGSYWCPELLTPIRGAYMAMQTALLVAGPLALAALYLVSSP